MTSEQYKAAGYTHRIEYEVYVKIAQVWAKTHFHTVADAVLMHLMAANNNENIRNVRVVLL